MPTQLGDVVTVADVEAWKHVDDSLVQIWKLSFFFTKSNFYPEFQTLSTRFGQDFEVEAQARF